MQKPGGRKQCRAFEEADEVLRGWRTEGSGPFEGNGVGHHFFLFLNWLLWHLFPTSSPLTKQGACLIAKLDKTL